MISRIVPPSVTPQGEDSGIQHTHSRRRRGPSSARLLAILSAFILCLVAALSVMAVVFVSRVFEKLTPWAQADLQWKAQRSAAEIAQDAQLSMAAGDGDGALTAIRGYGAEAGFDWVLVVDAEGKVLAELGKPPASVAGVFAGKPGVVRQAADAMIAWSPSEIEGVAVGRAAVAVSTKRLQEGEFLRQRIKTLAMVGSGGALLLSFLFVYWYVRPLVRLNEKTLRKLKELNRTLESRVQQRTAALAETNQKLEDSLSEQQLMQRKLVQTSRAAGMAEVATNVLHNVGNVLNSINVSATVALDHARQAPVDGLGKACDLLREHEADLPNFFAQNPKGKLLVQYLQKLSLASGRSREQTVAELSALQRNVEHIKVIVSTQQALARAGDMVERFSARELCDEALELHAAALVKLHVEVERDYRDEVDVVEIDRHKLLQILVNLFSNARDALADVSGRRLLLLRLHSAGPTRFAIEVVDSGSGIDAPHLVKVFSHGFTTKRGGHGFGLHASACAAIEMGGSLTVTSDGVGRGAVFRLELPRRLGEEKRSVA
jgi:signal transduction histidine kinase